MTTTHEIRETDNRASEDVIAYLEARVEALALALERAKRENNELRLSHRVAHD